MNHDFRRIASVAAMVGLAMGGMGGSAEVMPRPPSTGGAFGSGEHKRTRANPAGSKLWRKAKEGKIGVRW